MRGVVRYRRVALMAVALGVENSAASLVATYLSPLDNNDGPKLRETLRWYLHLKQNASSTGHCLGIHRRTVGSHITEIERRLGCTINDCRLELEFAMRFSDLLYAHEPSGGFSS
jgi:DNA-binding PucR family transcriptional regulator